MKILNLQETYLLDIIKSLESVKAQGFEAIQIDVLDYLEKNRKVYNFSSSAFDFGGVAIDVRDELGTKEMLKSLCEQASKIGISIIVKIKNTEYLGNAMHLLKKRIKLLLNYKEDKHIDLVGIDDKNKEAFFKMLLNYKKENGLLDINEIFELSKTSMFADENSKELISYLHELTNLGVKGFVFDDTLSKDTVLGERLRVYLSLTRPFCYLLNHKSENLLEYYDFNESEEQIMEAKNEDSYIIDSKLSPHVIFTPRIKEEYDSYWCTCDRDRDSKYEINRFKDEYRFSGKIRKANNGNTLQKTN